MKAYRLIEVKNGQPHSLFHAIPVGKIRTRCFPVDCWLKAESKLVSDGTSKHKHRSGFNVLLNLNLMRSYAKKFKDLRDLRIIPIEIEGHVRPKPRSLSGVYLAELMLIRGNWNRHSIPLKAYKQEIVK